MKMDIESGFSARSDISERTGYNGRPHSHQRRHMENAFSDTASYTGGQRCTSHRQSGRHRRDYAPDSKAESYRSENDYNSHYRKGRTDGSANKRSSFIDSHAEVKMLPPDDKWVDNTTVITANTSETGYSVDEGARAMLTPEGVKNDGDAHLGCSRYISLALSLVLAAASMASPIIMVVLPRFPIDGREAVIVDCGTSCVSSLVALVFKLVALLGTTWALIVCARHTLPRVYILRALLQCLVFLLLVTFWLFYGVHVLGGKRQDLTEVVDFASSLVNTLLFTHVLAFLLLEWRQIPAQFVLKVVRSPDGECKSYSVGQMSVQCAALRVLELYYRDFTSYNRWLENAIHSKSKRFSSFKMYDIEGESSCASENRSDGRHGAVLAAVARRRDATQNRRLDDELEYEYRLRKRRTRLITAAEESFAHVRRLQEDPGALAAGALPMKASEAAQAIFPSMASAMRKYLRVTRQQPRHTMESIMQHLALCLHNGVNSRAFLVKFLEQEPPLCNDGEHRKVESWSIACDQLPSRNLCHGITFTLRQGDVTLWCSVRKMPHISLAEEVQGPDGDRFVLKLSSDTSI